MGFIELSLDTIKLGKQALVFVNTKRSAEKSAEEISKKIKNVDLEKLSYDILNCLSRPTKQCERLAKCVKKGVAFHHAGLDSKQKEIIERGFREGVIKIIACTPTLAAGVDLPAFRTILKDLKRYGRRGLNWIPVLEYNQMAGRAGRPKFDKKGEAIAIAANEAVKDDIKERYINGEVEDIYSKLAVEPVLRTYLLSLIATGFVSSKKEIMDFFERTFWAFQFEDMDKLEKIILKVLRLLKEYEFIDDSKEDFVSANEVGNEVIKATVLGKRVAELYVDPLTANHLINCVKKKKEVNEFSFLQMISNTLEIYPLLRVRVAEYDNVQEELVKYEDYLLIDEPSMYDDEYEEFLSSVKTSLMFIDWINENDEEFLLEKYNIRPGELKVKLDVSNWLLYSSVELSKILGLRKVVSSLNKLKSRLRYGVKEELLVLLRLRDIGRVRARKLFKNNIKNLGDIKKADVGVLAQLIGSKTAVSIKEQVGQKVDKVPVMKRKGQLSLEGYK